MQAHQLASGVQESDAEREQRVLANFESAQIVLLSGTPIGLIKCVRNASDWHLLQIQLVPDKQRQGLGTRIIRDLMASARSANASLRLSVLRANPARRLYERLGFVVVEEKVHAYVM